MLRSSFFAVVPAVLLGGAFLLFWQSEGHTLGVESFGGLPTQTITIGSVPVTVEVASTEAEREQGLSGRSVLADGRGMLFVFPEDGVEDKGIWMKDMNFPLDIVWLASDGTIVTVDPNVQPSTYSNPQAGGLPEVFYPTATARYVIELPAGFMAGVGASVGDKVVLQ